MTRFAVPMIVMMLTAVAWAADVVVIEDWKAQKLGAKGIPDGWLGGQTWGLPQHDMTIEEQDGQRVVHLKSKIESSTIRKEIKGKVNLKETPILEWTWKGVVLPTNADCRKKSADDQAAQLYVDLDLSQDNLPPGTHLQIGSAVIEISEKPHTGCTKFAARFGQDALRFVNSPTGRALRLRGLNARIVAAGTVRTGDEIRKIPAP